MWRKSPDFRAEKKAQNPVTSLAVMFFSVPILDRQIFVCLCKSLSRPQIAPNGPKSPIFLEDPALPPNPPGMPCTTYFEAPCNTPLNSTGPLNVSQGAPKGRQQKGETGPGTHIFTDFR